MNLNWLRKKKDYPEFWTQYLHTFKAKEKQSIAAARFIAFDTETTGFDKKEDRILSIGAVAIVNNTIRVNDSFELYLEQEVFKPDTVKIHGIMKSGALEKVSELDAIQAFLAYIKNDVLVAHHAAFDYKMVNSMLQRHGLGKLKNKVIDTGILYRKSQHIIYQNTPKHYTLDELCKVLNVPKVDRHTASGDALITAMVFLKILSRLDKKKPPSLHYLIS